MLIRTIAIALLLGSASAYAQASVTPAQMAQANQLCVDRYKTEEYQAQIRAGTLTPDGLRFLISVCARRMVKTISTVSAN